MLIIVKYPPNYEEICKRVGTPGPNTVYAYGDVIYNPDDIAIPEDVIIHENVHCRQQGESPDVWWVRYLSDAQFRVSQEVEAYHEQFKFVCIGMRDRNKQQAFLYKLAKVLSGSLYNHVITFSDALRKIKYGL